MGKVKEKETTAGNIVREFSAGGVVCKRVKELKSRRIEVLWLVTESSPSKLYPKALWRLPKGWLDDKNGGKIPGSFASGKIKASEEDVRKAAIREVKEEGGIKAEIIQKIGTEMYFITSEGKKILKFVTFYLMEWLGNSPQGFGKETSEIRWLSFDDARKILSYSSEKKILDKAKRILEAGIQASLV